MFALRVLKLQLLTLTPTVQAMARVMRVAWYAVLMKAHDGPDSRLKIGYFATEADADAIIDVMWPWLYSEGFIDWLPFQTIAYSLSCMRFISAEDLRNLLP